MRRRIICKYCRCSKFCLWCRSPPPICLSDGAPGDVHASTSWPQDDKCVFSDTNTNNTSWANNVTLYLSLSVKTNKTSRTLLIFTRAFILDGGIKNVTTDNFGISAPPFVCQQIVSGRGENWPPLPLKRFPAKFQKFVGRKGRTRTPIHGSGKTNFIRGQPINNLAYFSS